MAKNFLILSFTVLVAFFSIGCKTSFEKIRISGDPELIYNKAYAYYENGDFGKAQTLFELIIPAYRGKKELEDIYFKYAYTYYNQKKFILSSYYFKNFGATFPNSILREEAEFMSAFSNFQLSPTYRLDQTSTEQAIEEFQLFINTFPESERVGDANRLIDECRRKMEKKAYAEGELYFNLTQYQASVLVFENLLKDFPETPNGEQIRFMIIAATFNLAENSVVDKQLERYKSVEKYANEYLAKYEAASENRKEVNTMLEKSVRKIKSLENDRYQNSSAGTRS
ncbi:MAG: outer membrane protein assembly factor BamD [Saprospiraceae bacterium]|nr:outer membrane protein assembly factor BamD [Saprospiraceae bacterium]